MSDIERLWTHQETARYLHVSAWTLTELVRLQCGPTMFRVGRNRRYDPVNVTSWLRENAVVAGALPTPGGRHVRAEPIGATAAPTVDPRPGTTGESGSVTR